MHYQYAPRSGFRRCVHQTRVEARRALATTFDTGRRFDRPRRAWEATRGRTGCRRPVLPRRGRTLGWFSPGRPIRRRRYLPGRRSGGNANPRLAIGQAFPGVPSARRGDYGRRAIDPTGRVVIRSPRSLSDWGSWRNYGIKLVALLIFTSVYCLCGETNRHIVPLLASSPTDGVDGPNGISVPQYGS